MFAGLVVSVIETEALLDIVNDALKDKETSACRLALQGLQPLLPLALESSFCVEVIPLLDSLLALSANPYWLVKVDLLEAFSCLPWVALEFDVNSNLTRQTNLLPAGFQRTFMGKCTPDCVDQQFASQKLFYRCCHPHIDWRRGSSSSKCGCALFDFSCADVDNIAMLSRARSSQAVVIDFGK